ncbi:MAG TPA: zinc ribbon domain-containing protein [Kofleriaceae bacterium]|nr:zinc ribbon domain-containing protein [Kofleriaceae bacterium]
MRCPSCGTDNAPDSRFCGGCGARFGSVEHRVAPTAKISDDAPYPQAAAPAARAVSQPSQPPLPIPRPASVPPAAQGSQPPHVPKPASSFARTTPRPRSAMSGSIKVPRRPMGLIVLVIVIDLALAGTGAALLAKGLSRNTPSPAPAAVK